MKTFIFLFFVFRAVTYYIRSARTVCLYNIILFKIYICMFLLADGGKANASISADIPAMSKDIPATFD